MGGSPGQRGGGVLEPLVVAGRGRCAAEARLVEAVHVVVITTRDRVLHRRGLEGVEMTATRAGSLADEVRRVAAAEVEVALGVGVVEARHLVGVASAPADLRAMVITGLDRGWVCWAQVRAFWDRSRHLSNDQRLLVAHALLGTDPALAAQERLDPDGGLRDDPWPWATFRAAVDREVLACEGEDVVAERERRRRAYSHRQARVRLHDDGTASLRLTGPAVSVCAIGQRLDRAARALRTTGDERTLHQLRYDTAATILLHGEIDLPAHTGHADRPGQSEGSDHVDAADQTGRQGQLDVLTPERAGQIAAVLNALPQIQLQVIVPADALKHGHPICPSCAGDIGCARDIDPAPRTHAPPMTESPPLPLGTAPAGPEPGPESESEPGQEPPGPEPLGPATIGGPPRGRGLVGEVVGPEPFFLAAGHARELALLPGTTLFRLLTDPADGRCRERSITAYRPDAQMRRQLRAADLTSRAPGSRLGAHTCDLDHVTPYGWAGGLTAETNLATLDRRTHGLKTHGHWHSVINDRRDISFTTLLGQVTRTREHDYRQYLHARDPDDLPPGGLPRGPHDLPPRLDRANRATYSAYTPAHRRPPAPDAWLSITHTASDGTVRSGPPRHCPPLDELLGITPGTDPGAPPDDTTDTGTHHAA